jgi:hypothetical protein
MAKVVRLETRRDLVQRTTAAQIEAQLSLYPAEALPAQARASVLNALHRVTRPDDKESIWPGGFTMISREQTAVIWDAIRALPADARPGHVRHAFDLVLLNLNQDTCAPKNVSTIMGVLERMGVIRRERRRIEGMQGPGVAVYVINPHVAWNGSLEVRKRESQAVDQPSLRLVPPTGELSPSPASGDLGLAVRGE